MSIEIATEDSLIAEAMRLGGHQSREAVVKAALEAYVRHQRQLEVISHFGTIDFDETYDYKKERQARQA
jgi:hypothetical protein